MGQCRHQGEVVERWRRGGGGGGEKFKIKIWGGERKIKYMKIYSIKL